MLYLFYLFLVSTLSISVPHILVAEDDDAGGEVAEDADDEEQRVKYGERYQSLQVDMTGAWSRII